MALKFSNKAKSHLNSPIIESDTSLTVYPGEGARFPSLTAGDTFTIVIENTAGDYEICVVTARVGDVFTITRAQESTTAKAFSAGALVQHSLTAATISSALVIPYANTAEAEAGTETAKVTSPATVKAHVDYVWPTKFTSSWNSSTTAFTRGLLDDSDAATARTTLGVVIGTDVQAYDADTAKLDTAQSWTKPQQYTPTALTSSSGSVAVDMSANSEFTITLSENTTFSAPTNQAAGKYLTLVITGASTYTVGWNSVYKASASSLPTAPAAGKKLTVCFRSDGTNMHLMGYATEA